MLIYNSFWIPWDIQSCAHTAAAADVHCETVLGILFRVVHHQLLVIVIDDALKIDLLIFLPDDASSLASLSCPMMLLMMMLMFRHCLILVNWIGESSSVAVDRMVYIFWNRNEA